MESTWTGSMSNNFNAVQQNTNALSMIDYLSTFVFLAAICYFIWNAYTKKKSRKQRSADEIKKQDALDHLNDAIREADKIIGDDELKKAYQRKWLFSYNEKDAYKKLKDIAEKHGYIVFAKVRLFDLVEPIKENPKYKTFLYKIQAKHVDFVLTNEKLVARYVIELDDNSHNDAKRAERDRFVDTVLESTGYKVLHTRTIDEQQILALIEKNEVR